ncbi:Oidioi.mRNA.OKI2018_I69.PAR.g9912.t1.cds [Oikopleura dioica]|uniref:Oidioi.mRNA.OKI2018_I69.PAR.g9912.t1.cds n=1 Tax=Oikopleura dioica TaxID=34765 RepID=A0ABN7RN39_OIKDI|nr:Oidioi.mRNA.OKI2018_I69.PAR.g9912.t1.cds [Oikopleura dioica]
MVCKNFRENSIQWIRQDIGLEVISSGSAIVTTEAAGEECNPECEPSFSFDIPKCSSARERKRFRFVETEEEYVYVDEDAQMKIYFDVNYMAWIILPLKARDIFSMICFNSKVNGEGFLGRVDYLECVGDSANTWERVDISTMEIDRNFVETTTTTSTTTTATSSTTPTTEVPTTACTVCEEKFKMSIPGKTIILKKVEDNLYEQTRNGDLEVSWLPYYKGWALKPKGTQGMVQS